MTKLKDDLEAINDRLFGQFISRFSLGDTWDLFIGEYCLSAHTVEFREENEITRLLEKHYRKFKYSVDQDDISKSTIMAANLRKEITNIHLGESKNIIISFENGSTMNVLTNTKVVDWQWCINKSGKSPYVDYDISCFTAGEIKQN